MTKAEFQIHDKGSMTLKVTGHAGAAEKGRDIICAAASMLTYTLAQIISNMHAEGKLKKKPTLMLNEDGSARITAKPKDEHFDECLHAFFCVQTGYHLLSLNYPQYVELKSFGDKA